jgi:hypothetical protein
MSCVTCRQEARCRDTEARVLLCGIECQAQYYASIGRLLSLATPNNTRPAYPLRTLADFSDTHDENIVLDEDTYDEIVSFMNAPATHAIGTHQSDLGHLLEWADYLMLEPLRETVAKLIARTFMRAPIRLAEPLMLHVMEQMPCRDLSTYLFGCTSAWLLQHFNYDQYALRNFSRVALSEWPTLYPPLARALAHHEFPRLAPRMQADGLFEICRIKFTPLMREILDIILDGAGVSIDTMAVQSIAELYPLTFLHQSVLATNVELTHYLLRRGAKGATGPAGVLSHQSFMINDLLRLAKNMAKFRKPKPAGIDEIVALLTQYNVPR